MGKLRVFLADDHAILRDGLALLIDAQSDMAVVGQAADGESAESLCAQLQPDVVVVDVSLPKGPGPELVRHLRERCPAARCLALTRHTTPEQVQRMLEAGATGYMAKRSAGDALVHAIRAVAAGERHIDPLVAQHVAAHAYPGPVAQSPAARGAPLSDREEQVMCSIARGSSNKEIATKLSLSIKTVESYKADALQKLGLRSRADIVRYGIGRGWLEDDGSE